MNVLIVLNASFRQEGTGLRQKDIAESVLDYAFLSISSIILNQLLM